MGTNTPHIYVACLAAYNAGTLHGRWIDATIGADEIEEEIEAMLAESPIPDAEEYAIHDTENFGGLNIGEYDSIETVAQVAELIEEHGELAAGVIDYYGGLAYVDEASQRLEGGYSGGYDSLEDWAYEFLDESGELSKVPDNLRSYFDYAKYARDVEMSGDIFTVEVAGDIYVFWSR